MGAILEVEVLSGAGHCKRSEAQLRKGDRACIVDACPSFAPLSSTWRETEEREQRLTDLQLTTLVIDR